MSIDTDEPREARTHFEIERLLPRATLLRVVLDTGRTHQIRVHLAAIEHPVCGDPQYGTGGDLRPAPPIPARRAAGLCPSRDRASDVDVRSPLPDDLVAALAPSPRPARDKRRGGPSKAAPPMLLANRPPEVGEGRFGSR